MKSGEEIGARAFEYAIDGGTSTAVFTDKVPTTTTPALVAARSVVLANPRDPHRTMQLICGGTDAVGERFALRATRWFVVAPDAVPAAYIAETACIAYATLGEGAYTASALGGVANLFADKMTLEAAKGVTLRAAGPKQPMVLEIEIAQAAYIEIEIQLHNAASADVLYRWAWTLREARNRQLDGTFA